MKFIFAFLVLISCHFVADCQSKQLPGFDFKLFDNTTAFELSKAVESEDTARFSEIISASKISINFKEKKFDNSLLDLAIVNSKYKSIVKLLALGANPNLKSLKDGSTPFLTACQYAHSINDISRILVILLKYGADVNLARLYYDQTRSKVPIATETALFRICIDGKLELVKILLEHGAKLDNYRRDGEKSIIYASLFNDELDILKYLLIDKKVPIPSYCYIEQQGTIFEKKIGLREAILNRKQFKDTYQLKLEEEILTFLATNSY